ncbi:putative acyl-(acyl-carrier-protein) desaturase DesA1 [Frankia sp. AiPs1]|uniref:acyl-ACP desaturase n=1 Tax=Frankia sp. AiPa1 TaxID=573492 RepID=UPI00202B5256|nr:acyl-ACP desaturase [Frankia sp. AiPa1]MCL9761974.1 acyl-ACP desaturase [Frankia sp. AiPa1]
MRSLTDTDLLRELEPVAEENLQRHLGLAVEWMPHEYVPWSLGRDFDELPWEPGQSTMPPAARISFELNLLTEDNLPSYHRLIVAGFGLDSVWGTWANRWTAEEMRHSIAMRDYLLLTRAADPERLEQDRMYQVCKGYDRDRLGALRTLAYVSFQELATRVSHRNTGRMCTDPVAERLLTRVAADENLHMIFYRNLVAGALEISPTTTLQAIRDELLGFEMPGAGIRDFRRKAIQIAQAGIYNLRIHHDDVVAPVLRQWRLADLEGLDAVGEQTREEIVAFMAALDEAATRQTEKFAAASARRDRAGTPLAQALASA